MTTNKRYFKCLKLINGKTITDYWHTSSPILIAHSYDFIIPLGYKKPNTHGKEIKEA